MRVTITIRMDTPAMQEASDAAEALERLADRMRDLNGLESLPLNIKDRDGNSVGECHLVASRRPV